MEKNKRLARGTGVSTVGGSAGMKRMRNTTVTPPAVLKQQSIDRMFRRMHVGVTNMTYEDFRVSLTCTCMHAMPCLSAANRQCARRACHDVARKLRSACATTPTTCTCMHACLGIF